MGAGRWGRHAPAGARRRWQRQWQHGIVRAALIEQPGVVTVREVPRPAVNGHALVRVAQAGLCGTDVKIASGQIPVRTPRVMGHEMTGVVVEPGPRGAVPAGFWYEQLNGNLGAVTFLVRS